MEGLSYGLSIPDQANSIISHLSTTISFYSEVQGFLAERAAIEREYGTKLQALSKKFEDKVSKKVENLYIGDTPAKNSTGADIRSSLALFLHKYTANLQATAKSHLHLSTSISAQVCQVLEDKKLKKEAVVAKAEKVCRKLESRRDAAIADRQKAREKYAATLEDLEQSRLRHEKAQASGEARNIDKAKRSWDEKKELAGLDKNAFILSTEIMNSVNTRFYRADLPMFQDTLQSLHQSTLILLANLFNHTLNLCTSHLTAITALNSESSQSATTVDPQHELDLYVEFNRRANWKEPAAQGWEEIPGFYETGEMNVEPGPKVVLQNTLLKAAQTLTANVPILTVKESEMQRTLSLSITYAKADTKGQDPDDVLLGALDLCDECCKVGVLVEGREKEQSVIMATLGNDQGSQAPHSFQPSTFITPQQCAFCKSNIWGIGSSGKGKTCSGCQIHVHVKCELKMSANCRNSKGVPVTASKVERRSSHRVSMSGSTISRLSQAPSASGSTLSPTDENPSPSQTSLSSSLPPPAISTSSFGKATVAFDFTSGSPLEVSVTVGEIVDVIDEDDGSGWVKVRRGDGSGEGIVPTTYLKIGQMEETQVPAYSSTTSRMELPPQSSFVTQSSNGPSADANAEFVRVIFSYNAAGGDEMSLVEGEMIQLTPSGRQYGEGWYQGYSKQGEILIFPSNYVEG